MYDDNKKDDGDTIYKAIIKSIKGGDGDPVEADKDNIRQAAEVIEKSFEILKKTASEASSSLSDFKTYLSSRDKGKNAVNAGFKHKNGKGYVEAALAHAEKQQKDISKIIRDKKLASGSLAEVKAKIAETKKLDDYEKDSTKRDIFDKKVFPCSLLRAKFAESSVQEEKDLAPVLQTFIEKYDVENNFSDESKDEYKDLKEKLEKLKKYQKGENYKKLDSDEKTFFNTLVSSLEDKVKKMEKKLGSNTGSPEKKPFFKTPGGIILIIAIVVVVLGGIAYLIKINSSSDEAGEGESE